MKKKGFTLIELLAVIVILAIIALIAIPTITGLIEKARMQSAKSSALGYIDAVEKQMINNQLTNSSKELVSGLYDAPINSEYGVKIKGNMPTNGWIYIGKNGVKRASLIIENKYVVNYENDEVEVKKGHVPSEKVAYLDEVANVGDYVIMTPNSTSYEIDGLKTGSGEDDINTNYFNHTKQDNRIINPSLQNKWVVIKKNNDGTIEMVSAELNDTNRVAFFGKTGYKNYIGVMEEIASQYANDKYTIATRNIGYNNQTLFINNDLNRTYCGSEPEDVPLGSKSIKESTGGGDKLYADDISFVINAYKVNNPDLKDNEALFFGMNEPFAISGRSFSNRYFGSTLYTTWSIPYANGSDSCSNNICSYKGEIMGHLSYSYNHAAYDTVLAIRPIVVLHPNLRISGGDGKSKETAWTLK